MTQLRPQLSALLLAAGASSVLLGGCFLFKSSTAVVKDQPAPDFLTEISNLDEFRALTQQENGTSFLRFIWDFKQPDSKVWFMNTGKHKFHEPFIAEFFRSRYPAFTHATYRQIALDPVTQEMIPGTIHYSRRIQVDPNRTEPSRLGFSLYFGRIDGDLEAPVNLDQIARVHERLKPYLEGKADEFVYIWDSMPQFMQYRNPLRNGKGIDSRPLNSFLGKGFEEQTPQPDVPVTYVAQSSFGYLRAISADQFQNGDYTNKDILIFEDVPIDIGPLSGVISMNPMIPNSHVVFRATNQKIPCMRIPRAVELADVRSNLNKLVKFSANPDGTFSIQPGNPAEADAYFASRVPALPEVRANLDVKELFKYTSGNPVPGGEAVTAYGAKGANFALLDDALRRANIPRDFTNGGFLIPYSFYDMHMKQPLKDKACGKSTEKCTQATGNQPLCSALGTQCSAAAQAGRPLGDLIFSLASGPAAAALVEDGVRRKVTLEFVRRIIRHSKLPEEVYGKVLAELKTLAAAHPALEGRQPRLRLRSSTNAEDLPGLTGAGLYTSKSACVADEGYEGQESQCMTPMEKQRTIARINELKALLAQLGAPAPETDAQRRHLEFLIADYSENLTDLDSPDDALRGVYASLWNDRAFLFRDYYRIPHEKIFMGVLVHPSFVDETMNGVVTAKPAEGGGIQIDAVMQVDEISITNPEIPGAVPEVVRIKAGADGSFGGAQIISRSNRVPAGAVILDETLARSLAQQVAVVYNRFQQFGPAYKTMDIEIKSMNNAIRIKQARPL